LEGIEFYIYNVEVLSYAANSAVTVVAGEQFGKARVIGGGCASFVHLAAIKYSPHEAMIDPDDYVKTELDPRRFLREFATYLLIVCTVTKRVLLQASGTWKGCSKRPWTPCT
jgi:hypothetical protein